MNDEEILRVQDEIFDHQANCAAVGVDVADVPASQLSDWHNTIKQFLIDVENMQDAFLAERER